MVSGVVAAPEMIEGEVARVGVVKVGQAVNAGEAVAEIDRQAPDRGNPFAPLVSVRGLFRGHGVFSGWCS
jgi:hypothetical protein